MNGLQRLSDGLTRVFIDSMMRERCMTTADIASWVGCSEADIWNLRARTDHPTVTNDNETGGVV